VIAIVAHGAISALGRGDAAFRVADEHEITRVRRDAELAALRKPFCARAEIHGEDRATVLLGTALDDCSAMLDQTWPEWRALRVGLAVGTSSGGMRAFEQNRGSALDRTYAGPLAASVRRAYEPATMILAACASSAIAIGLGRAWLLADRCDVVLAGGFDAVSVFVAAGFESLRATSGERGPRPFRRDRDGLSLGEGAAIVALAKRTNARAWITGFGATCDAHHLTSPDPAGEGLARAATMALKEAGAEVDLISAHGTATVQNDAAEAKTLASLATNAPVFSFKGTIGHTLGAAGALETLAALGALERGLAPATAGAGEAEAEVRDAAKPHPAKTALKLASAFGGANAALVLTRERPTLLPAPQRPVFLSRAVSAHEIEPSALAATTGYPVDRITRADDLVRYSLAAAAALQARHGSLTGAGIVVGLGLATIETNAKFLARLARPEPRRFPYTTPNAAAGECAVAFKLTGPAFAVGGGPHGGIEAIAVAADLVRAGISDRIVVIAADEAGPASEAIAPGTKSGAVALLVQSTKPIGGAEITVTTSYEPRPIDALPPMSAHTALLPLVDRAPTKLRAEVPWGGEATVTLVW
jgi:3-oxoacyl-[acyl-carrier-protein] synthase-1/3-oxoacyl-[acyl-carrier-protein] synthase II